MCERPDTWGNTSILVSIQRGMKWVTRRFPDTEHPTELTVLVEHDIHLPGKILSDVQTTQVLSEG